MTRHPSRACTLAALVLAVAGCAEPEPPSFDAGDVYGVARFKDHAPANVDLSRTDFPTSFVDSDGKEVDLAQYRGKRMVVLVVLRGVPRSLGGSLCPSCVAQLSGLMASKDRFEQANAEVLVVFPGPSERLGEMVRRARDRAPGEGEPPRMLLDRDCSACERLGIRDDLARPSTYILDTQGSLIYAYVGETTTDRPSVKAILSQLAQKR
jgi:peroxiredoxin